MKYNRRRFVKTVAAGVGGACLLAAHGAAFAPWRFFNAAEARLVDAITERIIPADQDPGASEAGVINFLDKQLASRLRRHQQTYRDGLVGVEETSRVMFEGSFVALSADCHATHSLDTRRSCAQCHPAVSNCGLDVTRMDTTARAKASQHDIHTMTCGDCHAQAPKTRP